MPATFLRLGREPRAASRPLRHPHHEPLDVVRRDGDEMIHHAAHETVAYGRRQRLVKLARHHEVMRLSWPAPGVSTPSARTGRAISERFVVRDGWSARSGRRRRPSAPCRYSSQFLGTQLPPASPPSFSHTGPLPAVIMLRPSKSNLCFCVSSRLS
jgi:hypothetical protein